MNFQESLPDKLHSLIHIASLTIGLVVFGFVFLYAKHELSVDSGWPDADSIHRLTLKQRGITGFADGVFNTVVARAYPGGVTLVSILSGRVGGPQPLVLSDGSSTIVESPFTGTGWTSVV